MIIEGNTRRQAQDWRRDGKKGSAGVEALRWLPWEQGAPLIRRPG